MIENKAIYNLIKVRWKFYILGYLIGLIGPLITQFEKDGYVFFPLNLLTVLCAIIIGTAAYYGTIKMTLFAATIRLFKYVLPTIIIVILASLLKYNMLENYGINIKPYVGL